MDALEVIGLILFWSVIENGAAIVAACLPTMRLLLGRELIAGLFRSIRSKLSLSSLRTKRSTRGTSETNRQETMSSEQLHYFDRMRGEPTVESRIEHSLVSQKNGVDGIAIHMGISQHESWV